MSAHLRSYLNLTLLAATLFGFFVAGDINGSNRTLAYDEQRIAFLQGVIAQEYRKLQTYSLVTQAASDYLDRVTQERDEAVKKLEDLQEKLWKYADGSCMVSAAARGAEWRLNHAGLWNKHLLIYFYIIQVDPTGKVVQTPAGHAVFVYEDSDGYMWCYSNGGSYKLGKNMKHDAFTLAYALYGSRVISAEFE